MKNRRRVSVFLLTTMFVAAACGGGDDATPADDGSAEDSAEPESPAPDAGTDPTAAPVATDAPTEDPTESAGAGTLEIVLDDGRSWSLEQYKCNYSPDNTGPFVELWGAGAAVPTGGEFIVTLATPPDPADTEPVIVGTFIDDANDILFPIVEGEAVSDGETMTMTLGMYADGLRAVGDPIDLTATVTCSL